METAADRSRVQYTFRADMTAPTRPPRVLVSAFACAPTWGSEIGMGWNWVTHLAKHCSLDVITEKGFSEDIDRGVSKLSAEQQDNLSFHYVDIGPRARTQFWNQGDWRFYRHYRQWQQGAYRLAVRLQADRPFDLCHQLNMIGFREPGFLWNLSLPFIWGPVGGYAQLPWAFLPAMGWRGAAYHICRNSLNGLQAKYYRRPKLAARRASAVFAATPEDRYAIERFYRVPCSVIGELGCSPRPHDAGKQSRRFDGVLRVVWIGKAVSRKCLPLALTAVQQASKFVKLELHIVGDGAGLVQARQLADEIGITTICKWHGALPHDEALKVIDGCDCMLFSSVQDATSTVVMEALMTGLPVICHDACGFGAVIDETCGIRVPLVSPSFSKQALAGALIQLGTDSSRLTRLRQGAIARANELAWDKKAQMVVGVYSDVLTRMHGGSASQVA